MKSDKKVAIYIPYIPDGNTTPHLGPLYLSAMLAADGFDTFVFDERIDRRALDALIDFRPDIVGVSAATAAYKRGLSAAARIKAAAPDTYVVFGGAHPGALPTEVAAEKNVDFVIAGEAEHSFPELCERLRGPGVSASELSGVKNLFYKKSGEIVHTGPGAFLDDAELDALPFPAFDRMDIKKYFADSQTHGLFRRGSRVLPIMSSRGCPHECAFCCRMMGRRMRYRSADSVMAEIEMLTGEYGADEIYFEDDNFTVNRPRALDILERLAAFRPKIHVKFANGIRADFVDAEILSAMKRAGVYSASFGIESGSPATLAKMKKNLDLDKARKNVELAKSMGFYVGSNCIIGYPGETPADARESLDFFLGLNLDSMAIVNLVPFPGTEARRLCEEKGCLSPAASDWDNYYFAIDRPIPLINTPELPADEIEKLIHRAYKKMYLRPSWLLKSALRLRPSEILRGASVMMRHIIEKN